VNINPKIRDAKVVKNRHHQSCSRCFVTSVFMRNEQPTDVTPASYRKQTQVRTDGRRPASAGVCCGQTPSLSSLLSHIPSINKQTERFRGHRMNVSQKWISYGSFWCIYTYTVQSWCMMMDLGKNECIGV
jgi:hypothetical protein